MEVGCSWRRGGSCPRAWCARAWPSRQYVELSTLLEYHEVMSGHEALTSWLRRHPEDLRLLMRDALHFAPADGARSSTTPSEGLRRPFCAPSATASAPRRGALLPTAAGPPATSACGGP